MTFIRHRKTFPRLFLFIFLTLASPDLATANSLCQALFGNSSFPLKTILNNQDLVSKVKDIVEFETHEIYEIYRALTKMYPPENHIYIGIGRSPTPVLALIEAIGQNKVNVPLSRVTGDYLSQKERLSLYRHFERFLPKPKEIENNSIILIDYTVSGISLKSAHEYILDYYNSLGAHISIKSFALVDKRHYPNTNSKGVLPEKIALKLERHGYDPLSEYGRYNIEKEADQESLYKTPNPYYQLLVEELRKKLEPSYQ